MATARENKAVKQISCTSDSCLTLIRVLAAGGEDRSDRMARSMTALNVIAAGLIGDMIEDEGGNAELLLDEHVETIRRLLDEPDDDEADEAAQ